MSDREKAIKDLTTIRWYHSLKKHDAAVAALDRAIDLLREPEPEPVKPILKRLSGYYLCSGCNSRIYREGQYCPTCGRRVKWDD